MKTEAIFQGIRTMVDGGTRLTFDLNELKPEEAAELFYLKGKYIKLEINDEGQTDSIH